MITVYGTYNDIMSLQLEKLIYHVAFKREEKGHKEDGPIAIAASDNNEVYSSGLQTFSTLEAVFTHEDRSGEFQWHTAGSLAHLKENIHLLEHVEIMIYNAKYNRSVSAYFNDTFQHIGNK